MAMRASLYAALVLVISFTYGQESSLTETDKCTTVRADSLFGSTMNAVTDLTSNPYHDICADYSRQKGWCRGSDDHTHIGLLGLRFSDRESACEGLAGGKKGDGAESKGISVDIGDRLK